MIIVMADFKRKTPQKNKYSKSRTTYSNSIYTLKPQRQPENNPDLPETQPENNPSQYPVRHPDEVPINEPNEVPDRQE